MQNLELNLQNTPDKPITILEGKANTPREPLVLSLSGDIESVRNFLSKRYTNGVNGKAQQFVDVETATVVADKYDMSIVFKTNPNDAFGTTIIGKLEFSPELKSWHINEDSPWNRSELVKFLRLNLRFFKDREQGQKLLASYQDLEIGTEGSLKQSGDTRGNKANSFEKKVKADGVPTKFTLLLPIFRGQKKKSFDVEIDIESTDANVKFYFASPELAELIENDKDEIFISELQSCSDFPIIFK